MMSKTMPPAPHCSHGGGGRPCRRFRIGYYVLLGLILISYGCESAPVLRKPITLEKPPGQAGEGIAAAKETAKTSDYEALKPPTFEKTVPEKKLPPRETFDPKRIMLTESAVMINAEKMPLSDFVIYALGETLKVAFVMDEATMRNKQPVTLRMPQAVPSSKALEIAIGVFEKYGLYLEERAGALYVLQKPPAAGTPLDIRIGRDVTDSPADILQVVPLRHVRNIEIESLIKEMYKSDIQLKPYSRENVLLLYGKAHKMKQILEFVETFDVPSLQGKKLFLLRLTYWQTEDFINQLSKILESLGFNIAKSFKDPGPYFLPIKQLNSILVISPDESTSKYILDWKSRLDTVEAAGTDEKAYIYVPQYSTAATLAASILKLYGIMPSVETSKTTATTAIKTAGPATGGGVQTATLPGLKIAAEDSKNTIIIVCTPAVYKVILGLLKGLDTPTKQVLIEATVVELTLTGELKYGLEWFIKNSQQGGQYILGTLGNLGLTSMGLSYQFISQTGNVQALISALATQNKANILSTPRLMVLDNKDATIQVGEDVPTVTSQVTAADITASTGQPSVLRTIQYRSTGVMLRVKPTVNTEGLVTLEIGQEVSQVGASGVGDSPIILTRRINTTVIVAHGQTIALGGLFKDTEGLAESKVPLLGDIPLLGNLFKYTAKTTEKTELLILVTPTILTSTDDAAKITGELRNELKWLR